jgi:D-alanyl-D-alanine carboxypeptidase
MVGRFMRRSGFNRFTAIRLAIALVSVIFLWTSPASAWIPKTNSSIIIDADSGQVLSEHNADAKAYPASLTKMMTLYLAFEALEAGKITLDQSARVSHHAQNQAPSKLGLVEGQMVPFRDLILGLITRSANDAAVVVAEALAGNERAFAERMTEKAHELRMTNTTYRNASGLPNPGQLTTARDLAKLAQALYRDFPKEYALFATEEFTYKGTTYVNHNRLMQSFEGMDGIKTGYIRASGFNLAASAVRNNRRLIGVVMGGRSAFARDTEMAQLLNDGFGGTAAPTIATAAATTEDDPDATVAERARRTIASLSPVGRAEAAIPSHARATRTRHGGWSIQVGAFTDAAPARKAAAKALARLPTRRGKATQVLAPGRIDKEPVFRARIVNFTEREATKACRTLHRKHLQCAVVAPGSVQQAALN